MPENKPITQRYYPSLADLINEDKVPQFLKTFLFGDGTNPGDLNKVFYRNLQVSKSANGDEANYQLDIVTKESISFELFGC